MRSAGRRWVWPVQRRLGWEEQLSSSGPWGGRCGVRGAIVARRLLTTLCCSAPGSVGRSVVGEDLSPGGAAAMDEQSVEVSGLVAVALAPPQGGGKGGLGVAWCPRVRIPGPMGTGRCGGGGSFPAVGNGEWRGRACSVWSVPCGLSCLRAGEGLADGAGAAEQRMVPRPCVRGERPSGRELWAVPEAEHRWQLRRGGGCASCRVLLPCAR